MNVIVSGAALKLWRTRLHYSQTQLAGELGLTQSLVGQMERGETPITRRTVLQLLALADRLGVARPRTRNASRRVVLSE